MRSHVAFLRGVNVGGNNRVPMADLRELTEWLGHTAVATHVNSGNVVFATRRRGTVALAAEFEAAIEARLGLRIAVVVLARADLVAVAAGNPFGEPDDPRTLHAVLSQGPLSAARTAAIERAQQQSAGVDRAVVVGATLYLHTPDGLGRSDLATRLSRGAEVGTARNWATITRLLAMLNE
ncbi:MAG TPA: DUF1697 domain-containing protein [Sporichthyaceae bacterium]|nr:DUF1697 domain-containing protein [Sporichthyaceae bacterium]